MKIVRIIARLNVGGPARHVVWLTEGLAGKFESVLVTGTVPPGEDDMTYFAREHGVEPVIIPEMSREISPKDLITIVKLFRLFRKEQPQIIHTHTAKAGTAGRIAGFGYKWLALSTLRGKPRNCRFVHTYHGHVFHSYYGKLKTSAFLVVERTLARLATDRIVVISPAQYEEIHGRFKVGRPDQFAVVPLGLDCEEYADWRQRRDHVRNEIDTKPDEVLVGIVGRLTEIKNHALFLETVERFVELKAGVSACPEVRFLIIGDGHLRPQLENAVREKGLERVVSFLGNRSDPENFYPALDISMLTSLNEGTPLTMIESMANARACLATAVGGVSDVLGATLADNGPAGAFRVGERGVVAKTRDAEGLSRALLMLVTDPKLRAELGARGNEFVLGHYSRGRLLKDIERLYDDLAGSDGTVVFKENGLSGEKAYSGHLNAKT